MKGTSAYKPLEDNTVRFALNVWAGWAPIILANDGFKAGQGLEDARRQGVQGRAGADRQPRRDARRLRGRRRAHRLGDARHGAAVHGRLRRSGTDKPRDSRVMPRIYQQVDWSNGGDGIVVRENIQDGGRPARQEDRAGRELAVALLRAEHAGGRRRAAVGSARWSSRRRAFEAAAAFNADKNIAAAVSWAPDIYNLAKVQGNRMLVTTATANKLIADVWFARADFAKDHPRIIEGLVRGIFDAHGRAQEAGRSKQKVRRADGRRLQHSSRGRAWTCSATPTAPTGPRTTSSS